MAITRGFDLDPSCKLWLPFYKYGVEQATIRDMSGNHNDGVITGAVPSFTPTPEPCIGWYFDGNDYMDCGGDASLNLLDKISILAWIRHDLATSVNNTIASRGVYSTRGWWLIFNDVNTSRFYSCQAAAVQSQDSLALYIPDIWQCMVFTKSGVNGLFYKNGIDVTAGHADLNDMETSADSLLIGSYDGAGSFLKSNIGELIILDRALSAQEVRSYFELTRHTYGV